jgi:hypothetical protein
MIVTTASGKEARVESTSVTNKLYRCIYLCFGFVVVSTSDADELLDPSDHIS